MPIDSGLIGALHIERVGVWDVRLVEHPHHTLFQTSTVDALLSGNYEGDVSFAELEAYGDFGLGTFDALNGEMITLDGAFYQVKADGRAYDVDERMKTPFAVVAFFEPREIRQLTASTNYTALRARLNELVATDATTCHAVRVDGHFSYVKTRSAPVSTSPTRPLSRRSGTSRPSSCTKSGAASSAFAFQSMSGDSTYRATTSTLSPRTGAPAGTCSSAR